MLDNLCLSRKITNEKIELSGGMFIMVSKSRRVLVKFLIVTVCLIGRFSVKVYADTDASFTRISG